MRKKDFLEKLRTGIKLKRKSGETLAEVMVSVVIFLLLVALLEGSVAFCTNAQSKSREIRKNTADALDAFWTAKDNGSLTTQPDGTATLSFQASGQSTDPFSVNVNLNSVKASGEGAVTFYTYGAQ